MEKIYKKLGNHSLESIVLNKWLHFYYGAGGGTGPPLRRLINNKITNTTINKKNNILAISVAVDATPLKPKAPAIRPTIRNINAQCNIISPCFEKNAYSTIS